MYNSKYHAKFGKENLLVSKSNGQYAITFLEKDNVKVIQNGTVWQLVKNEKDKELIVAYDVAKDTFGYNTIDNSVMIWLSMKNIDMVSNDIKVAIMNLKKLKTYIVQRDKIYSNYKK